MYLWPKKGWHNGNIHKITWLVTGANFKFSNSTAAVTMAMHKPTTECKTAKEVKIH